MPLHKLTNVFKMGTEVRRQKRTGGSATLSMAQAAAFCTFCVKGKWENVVEYA